jgi:hypothetical protein
VEDADTSKRQQDTSRPTIAGLGDAAAVDRVSWGAFGGYQTEIPHQLAGVLKARQIADLGQPIAFIVLRNFQIGRCEKVFLVGVMPAHRSEKMPNG